jgi:MoxR-like ATPase
LLWGKDLAPKLSTSIVADEIEVARQASRNVPWSMEAREAFEAVLKEISREGVQPGDRRLFKTVGAARAFAWLCGDEVVVPEHLEVAVHLLWDDPVEQPATAARVIGKIANPVGMRLNQLLIEAEAVIAATDPRDLAAAAKSSAKLAEIDRQLAALKGHARLGLARDYLVQVQATFFRLAGFFLGGSV